VIAHVIGWVVVAPVLDILIYAEPANKVFAQGVFAAVSNSITGVIVGGLLVLAYTKKRFSGYGIRWLLKSNKAFSYGCSGL
jgi:uncharacterized membrane protein